MPHAPRPATPGRSPGQRGTRGEQTAQLAGRRPPAEGLAPQSGHVSNFPGVPASGDHGCPPTDSSTCDCLSADPPGLPILFDSRYGPAGQAEVRSSGKHVPVIGPDIALSKFLRGSQMHSVRSSQEDLAGSGNHQDSSSPQQRFVLLHRAGQTVPAKAPELSQGGLAQYQTLPKTQGAIMIQRAHDKKLCGIKQAAPGCFPQPQ
jgi:hypothetical protein